MSSDKTIYLGITLAGAVSAGAYSAGVIYYLLQNLRRWEQAKGEDDAIPNHTVKIVAMGGASAGSLVTAATLLSLSSGDFEIEDGQKEHFSRSPNKASLIYQAWVNMLDDDSDSEPTLEGFLRSKPKKSTGAQKSEETFALLNSAPLDKLKNIQLGNFTKNVKKREIDSWRHSPWLKNVFPKDLDVIFSLTNLRGLDVGVHFGDGKGGMDLSPAHMMRLHRAHAHFNLDQNTPTSKLELDLLGERKTADSDVVYGPDTLLDTAMASGAFPLGFEPKVLKAPKKYVSAFLQKVYNKNLFVVKPIDADEYEFSAIDGGTLNNEPFSEVNEVIKERIKEIHGEMPEEEMPIAHILIDPFPNFEQDPCAPKDDWKPPRSLLSIISKIIGALRGQAMLKSPELTAAFSNNSKRGMIFPSRRDDEGIREDYALATGVLGGFGGLLDESFREHDFKLGMKNCQSFIRRYLYVRGTDEAGKPILPSYLDNDWLDRNSAMYQRFVARMAEDDHRIPIIPDMELPTEGLGKDEIHHYSVEWSGEFPKIGMDVIKRMQPLLGRRLRSLLFHEVFRSSEKDQLASKEAEKIEFGSILNGWMIGVVIAFLALMTCVYGFMPKEIFWLTVVLAILFGLLVIRYLLGRATKEILRLIIAELKRRGQWKAQD